MRFLFQTTLSRFFSREWREACWNYNRKLKQRISDAALRAGEYRRGRRWGVQLLYKRWD